MKSDRWQSLPLKRVVESVQSGTSINGTPWPADGNQPGVLKTSSVYGGVFDPTENKEVDSYDLDRVSCPVLAGSLIVSRMNTKQHLGVAAAIRQDFPNLYLPDRLWAVTFCGAEPRFIDWWTKTPAYRSQVEAVSVGTSSSMQNISQGDFLELRIELPDFETQHAIADYLDRETARIDTLIEEQQHLIEMLRERRSAVISSALAPNDSWVRRRIKHIGETSLGKMLDAGRAVRDGDQPRPYVRAADVRADGSVNLADLNEMPFSGVEMEAFDLRAGDVLLIEGGATVGRPGFMFESAPGIAFQKTVNRLRVGSQADARFVYWSMLCLYESSYYANHYGSVSFVHLTGEKLRKIELRLPPLDKQRAIAVYLDVETAKIDTLIAETERFIELARERRAALITAAVTGQIDVRELV
ncbi:restriction endonuclease subunit S [Natronosporangium hydrolyticum]|uniref:Restriction endonuclease subunit S n=1 Tax=Natronosporangium hydrolyticum TaxID=2811111 RepID=A0A895Y554_9ACTN|nr:restriction endonuclease subunit S [Natronosporangium hydrolyticum]QSB12834.1 restriction endonuclease subunit S [Natronosporangium hydrolyticum]